MSDYSFSPEVASRYGVDEAIFLHSLAFWVRKNRANRTNLHDGRYWSYNTQKALAELFPFWTARQIGRIVVSCKEQGAILTGNWNEDKSVRTMWYTLGDEAAQLYGLTENVKCILPDGEMPGPQGVAGTDDEGGDTAPILPNGDTEPSHANDETVKCNKVTVTYADKNNDTPYYPPKGDMPELFIRFWDAYPRRRRDKKTDALKAWKKLKPDVTLCRVMLEALELFKVSAEWNKDGGRYIPLPASWLRGRRWEDESILDRPTEDGQEDGAWI